MADWHADVKSVTPSNGERFVSVEFLHENGSTAAVPLLWIKNKRVGSVDGQKAILGKCFWPPKTQRSKVNALAAREVQPEKATWETFDVELLKYSGTMMDCRKSIQEASGKEDEGVGDDSSEEESITTRREKAKHLRRRRQSEGSESGSNSDCDTSPLELISNSSTKSAKGSGGGSSASISLTNGNRGMDLSPKQGDGSKTTSPRKQGEGSKAASPKKQRECSKTTSPKKNGDGSETASPAKQGVGCKDSIPSAAEKAAKTPKKTGEGTREGPKSPKNVGGKQLLLGKNLEKTHRGSFKTPEKRSEASSSKPNSKTPARPDKRGPVAEMQSLDLIGSPGKRQRIEHQSPLKDATNPSQSGTQKSPKKRDISTPAGRMSPSFGIFSFSSLSTRNSPVEHAGAKPMNPLSLQMRKAKQSPMTNYVASISDREVAEIDEELGSLQEELLESPGTNRSDSPALSDCSDASFFKTPREKSAYRALNFSPYSPSTASGFRHLHSLIGDVKRDVLTQLKSIENSLTRVLTCVLPPLETNIAEDIPRLPLSDKEGEKQLNELLANKEDFNKVVTFLYGLGGTNPREAVYAVLKTIFTDVFASTKSMKGIRRTGKPAKDAFLGTALFKAVMCAVRRRFKTATVSEVIELTANWLKDAPSRERKRQKRQESREKILKEYDDDDDTEHSSS